MQSCSSQAYLKSGYLFFSAEYAGLSKKRTQDVGIAHWKLPYLKPQALRPLCLVLIQDPPELSTDLNGVELPETCFYDDSPLATAWGSSWVGRVGYGKHKVGWGRLGEVKGMVVWGWCFGRGFGQGSDHRKVKVPLGSAEIAKSSWHVGLGCVCVYLYVTYT